MEEPNPAAWVHSKLGVAMWPNGELFGRRIESGCRAARAEHDFLFGIENDLVGATPGIACAAVSLRLSPRTRRERVRKLLCFSSSLVEAAKPVREMVGIPGVVGIHDHVVRPDKTPVAPKHIQLVTPASRQVILGHHQASGLFTRWAGAHLKRDFIG